MATTAKGIYSPDGTSTFDPVADMATMATSIDSLIDANVADLAALAALTGMSSGNAAKVREGQMLFLYNGTAWVQITTATFATTSARDTAYAKASAAYRVAGTARARVTGEVWDRVWSSAGLWRPFAGGASRLQVKPSGTPVNGTVQADGAVTFSAASTMSVAGAFGADFDKYTVHGELDSISAAGYVYIQLRSGTTTQTSAYSNFNILFPASAPTNSYSVTGTSFPVTYSDATTLSNSSFECVIHNPYKSHNFVPMHNVGVGQDRSVDTKGGVRVSTQFDGFTLTADGGATMTGRVWVEGHAIQY